MKKYIILINAFAVLTGLITFSCDPDVDIPKQNVEAQYTTIYMPQASGGPRTFTLDIKETSAELALGAAYGGIGNLNEDVTVTIEIDPSLVEAYNAEKRTSYSALPAEFYALTGSDVIIQKGKSTSSMIKVFIQTQAITPFKEYMLAAKIGSTSGQVPVNENLKVAYFIVKTVPRLEDYPAFERVDWAVQSFSTEEPTEANWGNGGQVLHTFDSMNNTFWHSKWNGGEAQPPHWFVIDMGEAHAMHGLSFLTRQNDNSGKPKEVLVELSEDGINWSPGGSLNLQNVNSLQRQFLIDGFNNDARYFKVTVQSSYNANYTHLAEIYAF